jgi:uncharacterized repeat protein (TIGR01451 family)
MSTRALERIAGLVVGGALVASSGLVAGTVMALPAAAAGPGLTLAKSATFVTDEGTPGKADKGDVIRYRFDVENTGDVPLDDVDIDDPKVDVDPPFVPVRRLAAIAGTELPQISLHLEPGGTWTFFGDYTVTQDDVDASPDPIVNTATATGTTSEGGTPVRSPQSSTSTAVVDAAPQLALTKTSAITTDRGTPDQADVGDVVTYAFDVQNTGNTTVLGLTIDDSMTGLSTTTPRSVTSLAPGAKATFTATYTVVQDDIDQGREIYNLATAKGATPRRVPVVSNEDDAYTAIVRPEPVITLVKTAALTTDGGTVGRLDAGDVLTYTFTVANPGGMAVNAVRIEDPKPGVSAVTPKTVEKLPVGGTATFTATYVVTAADVAGGGPVVNTATALGFVPPEGRTLSNEASVSTPLLLPVTAPPTQPAQPTQPTQPVTPAPSAPVGPPAVTSRTSVRDVVLPVDAHGQPQPVLIHDDVTLSGLVGRVAGRAAPRRGEATLYGPVAKPTAQSCTPGRAVATVPFDAGNGVVRTGPVTVREPGYYVWVARVDADAQQAGATHACGLAPAITRVHRAPYGPIEVQTGFSGWLHDLLARATAGQGVAATSVRVPAIGMRARLSPVGIARGEMLVPHDVRRGGWLARSAAPGEQLGSTVIAGHVSDRTDRPGAFDRLRQASKGQVVLVRDAAGRATRYRISSVTTQPRDRGLAGAAVSTTAAHRLVLVTCTGRVTYPDGRFHYTQNLVVVAKPVG